MFIFYSRQLKSFFEYLFLTNNFHPQFHPKSQDDYRHCYTVRNTVHVHSCVPDNASI